VPPTRQRPGLAVVLDGVADQVDEHLTQAGPVGQHQAGVLGRAVLHRDPPGLGQRPDHRQDLRHHLRHGHRDRLQLQLTRLDPADVEQLVDQCDQVPAGAQDLGHRLLVLGLLRLQLEQLPEAEDRVERRAQLVAHARQERGLVLAGGRQAPLLAQPDRLHALDHPGQQVVARARHLLRRRGAQAALQPPRDGVRLLRRAAAHGVDHHLDGDRGHVRPDAPHHLEEPVALGQRLGRAAVGVAVEPAQGDREPRAQGQHEPLLAERVAGAQPEPHVVDVLAQRLLPGEHGDDVVLPGELEVAVALGGPVPAVLEARHQHARLGVLRHQRLDQVAAGHQRGLGGLQHRQVRGDLPQPVEQGVLDGEPAGGGDAGHAPS
jgi:hypothetical protein